MNKKSNFIKKVHEIIKLKNKTTVKLLWLKTTYLIIRLEMANKFSK